MTAARTLLAFVLLTVVAVGLHQALDGNPVWLLAAGLVPLAIAVSPEADDG